jgi:hypothetical protein
MTAFGDAFKAARKAGKTTFKFNGKSYHTKTKEDVAKAPKPPVKPSTATASVPTPTPSPRTTPSASDATERQSAQRVADVQSRIAAAASGASTPSTPKPTKKPKSLAIPAKGNGGGGW